ncbi:MAG: radical SAM protein [Candidatus Lokiarchaeota archaeon]|nr:radical SAM protein [Candidatus Lokiarchaeota archaeon]
MDFRFFRPDTIPVWQNEQIITRFKNYKAILDGKNIARFLIAKTLSCDFKKEESTENLERILHEKSKEFNELLKNSNAVLKNRDTVERSYLNLAEEISYRYLTSCKFCERRCGANRIKNELGFCMIPKDSYVTSAFLHMGEESVLIPSGTIFFQGCNFGCVFCQNFDISQTWKGKANIEDVSQKVDKITLARIAERLANKGAQNINYVGGDPIPNIHTIIGSLSIQVSNICQLWNSNFYLTNEALSLIIDFIDFWLPDFKYGNNQCGERLSGVKNYFDVVSRNHKRIHDQGSGEIIIRHLVMPGHVECCSKPILNFIAKEIPKCVVNIMSQYRPEYKAHEYPDIKRKPTREELLDVKQHASKLDILYEPVS